MKRCQSAIASSETLPRGRWPRSSSPAGALVAQLGARPAGARLDPELESHRQLGSTRRIV